MRMENKHIVISLAQALALLVGASACDSGPEPIRLPGTAFSSQCRNGDSLMASMLVPERAYCDAEVLSWSYDASAEMLSFLHARYEANCCAERRVYAQMRGEAYEIVEVETSLYGDEPCGCKCVFDVQLDVPIPAAPAIDLAVLLDGRAPWDEKQETLWSGSIDLTAGAGEVILDDTPNRWCEPMPPPPEPL